MSDAKIGWGGQFHLHNGAAPGALVKLAEVKSFTLPQAEVEQVEVTHLESPNRRREYIAGMVEDGTLEVVMNYVPGSATDVLLLAALTSGSLRSFKAVIPRALANWEVTNAVGSGVILVGYDRGSIEGDAPMEATATFRVSGATNEAAGA